MLNEAENNARIYRGWLVLLGAFLASMFATIAHTCFGLFVVPASTELNISRANANSWLIAVGVGSAVIGPFAGRIIDRFSVRLIMAIGGVVLALSLIGISMTNSLMLMLLLAIPIAFSSDAAGSIAASTVTARWFRRRRGRALALSGIAASASGFALSPLVAYLIITYGWRTTLPIIGILAGSVIVSMTIFLIRTRPTEEQLLASGELNQDASSEEKTAEQQTWTYRELLTNRNFICLALGAGLLFASDRAILISMAPYLSDTGIDLQRAGFLISALTGSSIAGKLIVGYIADHVDPRKIFLVVAALHILLLLTFIAKPDFSIMIGIAMVLGIGIGGVLPTNQVLMAAIIGSRSFGTATGTAVVFHQILMMTTLRFVGEVRDRTGSYELAFQVFIGVVLVSTFLIWQLKIPRRTGFND